MSTNTLPAEPTAPQPAMTVQPESTGITREEVPLVVPLAPAHVTADLAEHSIVVTWTGTGESVMTYEIYRKRTGSQEWGHLADVPARKENTGNYQWSDTTATPKTSYVYGVMVVSPYEAKSAMAESTPLSHP